MKIAGIIAEYNPFHNGHQFHIEETRRRTGADYVIALISGDFVQRGAPAMLDKYFRARTALLHGADLVLELPTPAVLQSAEGFATGGIALLSALRVVDVVSCGCESADADPALFGRVVTLLADEPAPYRQTLASLLKTGQSYPAAREAAVRACLQDGAAPAGDPSDTDPLGRLLSEPNNILAVEYARAIQKTNSTLSLCLIPRQENEAHRDPSPCAGDPSYLSARAIRDLLLADPDAALPSGEEAALRAGVPRDTADELLRARAQRSCLCEDDFSALLSYAITSSRERLDDFGPERPDLIRRLERQAESFTSWSSFTELVKTKNQTYTAISRLLAQILLRISREDLALAAACRFAPYARVLGFRREAAPLLKELRTHASVPILSRPAKEMPALGRDAEHLLRIDLRAHEIYQQILRAKSGCETTPELRQPPFLI